MSETLYGSWESLALLTDKSGGGSHQKRHKIQRLGFMESGREAIESQRLRVREAGSRVTESGNGIFARSSAPALERTDYREKSVWLGNQRPR